MNTFRAKRIADSFAMAGAFEITNKLYGLEVSFRNRRMYFEEEASFWAFLFYLAHAEHQESIVSDVQAKFIA